MRAEITQYLIYWKLAIFKWVNGCIIVGLMAIIAGTTAVHWSDLTGFERFIIIAAAIVQVCKFTDGFVDQAVSRLLAGKPPIGNGNGNTDRVKAQDANPTGG